MEKRSLSLVWNACYFWRGKDHIWFTFHDFSSVCSQANTNKHTLIHVMIPNEKNQKNTHKFLIKQIQFVLDLIQFLLVDQNKIESYEHTWCLHTAEMFFFFKNLYRIPFIVVPYCVCSNNVTADPEKKMINSDSQIRIKF